jgi:hypothetical protein
MQDPSMTVAVVFAPTISAEKEEEIEGEAEEAKEGEENTSDTESQSN